MRVTLKDVAEKAGVSRPTANLILLGRGGRFSAATRLRVQEAAKDLNYRPNLAARALSGQRSLTVGLVISADYAHLLPEFMPEVQRDLIVAGFLPVVMWCDSLDMQRMAVKRLIDVQADCIMISPVIDDQGNGPAEVAAMCADSRVPMLEVFSHHFPATPGVRIDWKGSGSLAVNYARTLNCSKIVLWTFEPYGPGHKANPRCKAAEFEADGYHQAMLDQGLTPRIIAHNLPHPVLPAKLPPAITDRNTPFYLAAKELMRTLKGQVDCIISPSSSAAAHLSLLLRDEPELKPDNFVLIHPWNLAIQLRISEQRAAIRQDVLAIARASALLASHMAKNGPNASEDLQSSWIEPKVVPLA